MNKIGYAVFILLIIGVLDSTYLTTEHYFNNILYCPNVAGFVSCSTVLSTNYSTVLGIPIAVLGFIWTIIMLVLVLAHKMKTSIFVRPIWYMIGLLGVFYSILAQILIGKICIYCNLLDITILVSVLLLLFAKPFK